jgi:hypothetical protein
MVILSEMKASTSERECSRRILPKGTAASHSTIAKRLRDQSAPINHSTANPPDLQTNGEPHNPPLKPQNPPLKREFPRISRLLCNLLEIISMKTRRYLGLICGMLLAACLPAQNIYLDWAASTGGTGFDIGRAVALDPQGNVYSTGFFQGTADFDPDSSLALLTSAGDNDVYIQKLDPNGHLVWVHQIGGSAVDEGKGIALDAAGNVYVTGRFSTTVDFDPGTGQSTASALGNTDAFVLKLDNNGNYLWHTIIGANGSDEGNSIAVDNNGVYTVGYFQGTADFDPGLASLLKTSVAGTYDAYIQALDPNGNLRWAHQLGDNGLDYAFGVTIGPNSKPYLTGCFQGTADFDPGIGTTNLSANFGATAAYILALNSNGSFDWVQQIGVDNYCIGYALSTTPGGDLFVTGGFNGSNMDFDPSSGSNLKTSDAYDVWVQKLSASGAYYGTWTFGGLGDDYGYAIRVTRDGAVYFTGGYGATVDFDPSPGGTNTITSYNNTFDMFIERLDTMGNFVWARSIGGGGIDYGFGLAADDNGHVVTTGCYDQVTDFDTEAGVFNLSSNGNADIFVHQLKQCTPSSGSLTLSACDSLQVNGQTFYTAGTFTQTLQNQGGCDSTLTLTLNLGQSSGFVINQTACTSFILNNILYDSTGSYVQLLTNAAGCDSVLSLNLVVVQVDTTVLLSGGQLMALGNGLSYQWLDCNNGLAPIGGATAQTYTPSVDGSFAVALSQNGCADTSGCHGVITNPVSLAKPIALKLVPNPTTQAFKIALGDGLRQADVEIHDALGKMYWQGEYSDGQILELEAPKGIYFVVLRHTAGSSSLKLCLE